MTRRQFEAGQGEPNRLAMKVIGDAGRAEVLLVCRRAARGAVRFATQLGS